MEEIPFNDGDFRVIGPKVGESEEALARALVPVLACEPNVLRAYLALVKIGRARPEVALCILFSSVAFDDAVIKKCAMVFYRIFHVTESLAIIPLSVKEEERFKAVPPFYAKSIGGAVR